MNEIEMVQRTKTMIEKLGAVRVEELPFCSKTMYWQINKFFTKSTEKNTLREMLANHFREDRKAEHGHYCVQRLDREVSVVYGNFRIKDKEDASGFYGFPYEVTVIMKNGIAERFILTGNREEPAISMVKSDEDHFYMLKESDVLYIEASHNDSIWHCRDTSVRCRGTLKELEMRLPRYFFRIQRGYIVNTYHIKSLEQRELTIDNGDILLIPVRTYYEVKKQLKKICEAFAEMSEEYEKWNWLNLL